MTKPFRYEQGLGRGHRRHIPPLPPLPAGFAITMRKNIIPFEKAKRSVKEVVERFYQDLDDIEEIVIIAKDREGEWVFANSELENELEWIGSLYKFINKGIMDDEEF